MPGFEVGEPAGDYITKPFSLSVLRARVGTQLRRQTMADRADVIQTDRFVFDFDRMHFTVDGDVVELSKTEKKLLLLLFAVLGVLVPLVIYRFAGGATIVERLREAE